MKLEYLGTDGLEDVLAEEILTGNYQPNDELVMDMKDDKIVIEKKQ